MSLEQILRALASEAAAILAAPVSFSAAVLIVAGITYVIAKWAYSTVIAHQRAEIANLERVIRFRDEELSKARRVADDHEMRIKDLVARTEHPLPRLVRPGSNSRVTVLLQEQSDNREIDITWDGRGFDSEMLLGQLTKLFEDAGWKVHSGLEFDFDGRSTKLYDAGITVFVRYRKLPVWSLLSRVLTEAGLKHTMVERSLTSIPRIHIGPPESQLAANTSGPLDQPV